MQKKMHLLLLKPMQQYLQKQFCLRNGQPLLQQRKNSSILEMVSKTDVSYLTVEEKMTFTLKWL